jgi:hypothetical protein
MQLTEIALRRSSSERIFMESICNFDDTLPLPDEVEREFLDNAGDDLTALAWLVEHDIDPAPILENVGKIALIQYWNVWNPETGRYRFLIYAPDHVGPKYPLVHKDRLIVRFKSAGTEESHSTDGQLLSIPWQKPPSRKSRHILIPLGVPRHEVRPTRIERRAG